MARRQSPSRRGAVLIWVAISIILLFGISAMAIDLSTMAMLKTQLQVTATSAAAAGAVDLPDDAQAKASALAYAERNMTIGKHGNVLLAPDVTVGNWNYDTRIFQPNTGPFNAVKVVTRRSDANGNPVDLGLSKIFGYNDDDLVAEAIAARRPRDIMLVLDYSSSMNDDSELRHIGRLGRSAIEANLLQIYTEMGSPRFGNMQWTPRYISSSRVSTVKRQLGLRFVRYPFPSGSWDDYIRYVMEDSDVRNAGYRRRYGYLTLVNYWLDAKPLYSETPVLWRTSEQPITAVKDAVTLFLAYVQVSGANDKVGLVSYTHPTTGAVVERSLTTSMGLVETASREMQAGHYMHYTNIGAGLEAARNELVNNGRTDSFKMVVLITDGKANRPSGFATGKVLQEANRLDNENVPVLTISLGADADADLMGQVASITGGVHFNIPGGKTVAEYEADLKDVFRAIAKFTFTDLVY